MKTIYFLGFGVLAGCAHTPATYDVWCRRGGKTYLQITIPEDQLLLPIHGGNPVYRGQELPANECMIMHSSVGKLF